MDNKFIMVNLGNIIKCYVCESHVGDGARLCDSLESGEAMTCQMSDNEAPNYGDVCSIEHTGR